MFEQVTFTDHRGVKWLNRPGPKRGVPGLVVPIVSLIPTTLVGTIMQVGVQGYLIIFGIYSVTFYGLALIAGLIFKTYYQTCPECHTTRMRGYRVCSGCGYPQS